MPQRTGGEIAELNESGFCNFLHLFDEQWFFCNALRSHPPRRSAVVEGTKSSSARQLVGTPSIQPIRQEGSAPANYGSGDGRKLSCCYGSLEAPVQPSEFSYSASKMSPRPEAPARRCANPHLILWWAASNRKSLHHKKWRSLGDLETMELQGFKDLGFVFNEREGLLPGLRGRKEEEEEEEEEDGGMKRSYFPAAWFTRRSASPMALGRSGCRSVEEMKEQLRFWARAVAFDVRREC